MFTMFSPPVFRKPPETLLVNSTSCKCRRGKLDKKPLLLVAAGYPQPESPWYLPLAGARFLECTSHRALQGTKPHHVGPRLVAGFGRGRCPHPSPRGGRVSRLQDLVFLTPCSCEAPLGVTTTPFLTTQDFAPPGSCCSAAVLPAGSSFSASTDLQCPRAPVLLCPATEAEPALSNYRT